MLAVHFYSPLETVEYPSFIPAVGEFDWASNLRSMFRTIPVDRPIRGSLGPMGTVLCVSRPSSGNRHGDAGKYYNGLVLATHLKSF